MKARILTTILVISTLTLFAQNKNASVGMSSNTTSIQNGSSNSHQSNYSTQSNYSSNSNSSYKYSERNPVNDNNNSNNSNNSNSSSYSSNTNSSSNSWSNNNNYNNNNWNNNSNSNYYYNNNNYGNNGNSDSNGYKAKDENYGSTMVSESTSPSTNPFNILHRVPLYNNNNPINKLFNQIQTPSQTFTINAQSAHTLKGNNGTVIKIKANSFVDKNGNVVQGDVNLEVKEIYGKGDMISSNAHTVSNDMILESGGEMYMDASRNGEPLMLANDKPIQVEMPTNGNGDMQLFYGRPDQNSINWTLANNNTTAPTSNSNVNTGNSYNFNINGLGWINCDKFRRNNGRNTKIAVRVPERFDSTNTAVFIVFKGQNSVTRFDGYSEPITYNGGQFETKWYSVPVGAEVTLVAISELNGEYYSASKPVRISQNMTEELTFSPTTMELFKADMAKLP